MLYVFLLVIGLTAVAMYLLFIFSQVPGAAEERLGVYDPLPDDLGKWKLDESSGEASSAMAKGLKREVRVLHQPTTFGGGKLIRQVRYRDLTSNEIVSVEPEQVSKRRRVRK